MCYHGGTRRRSEGSKAARRQRDPEFDAGAVRIRTQANDASRLNIHGTLQRGKGSYDCFIRLKIFCRYVARSYYKSRVTATSTSSPASFRSLSKDVSQLWIILVFIVMMDSHVPVPDCKLDQQHTAC